MRLRQYIRYHLLLLLFVAAFAVYGYVAIVLLKNQSYHCFMHDILHLYCPLCGGTRAFLSCLRFELGAALLYNPAVILLGLFLVVLDVRALVFILRGTNRPLFPRRLLPLTILWLAAFTVLRNALAFFGIDPVGDIAAFWAERMTPVTALLATLLLFAAAVFLCAALFLPQKGMRHVAAFLTGAFTVFLVSLLYTPLLLLLLLPLCVGFFLLYRWISNREAKGFHS